MFVSIMKFQILAGALCLDFINTLDNRPVPERRRELLGSYDDLLEWASQAGAIDPALRSALIGEARVHPAEARAVLASATDLRETLCRMIEGRLAGKRITEADRRSFSDALGAALSRQLLQPTRTGFRLEWMREPLRLDAVLWPIAKSAGDLFVSADLDRVRECGEDTCRWMFVDRSKNHSRRWCDMKVCGNRTKVRKFYRRAKKNP
jgi:predicted RNA-binding Zn ribbon-like protein